MKKAISCTGLLVALSLLFTTCRKIDWEHVFHGPGKRDCNLVAYNVNISTEIPQPFLFTKKYNTSGDLVEIDCRFNNVLFVEDLFHYRLRVVYGNRKVYLINLDSPHDTSMTVFFNEHGRVEKATGDDVLYSYRFQYRQNRLYAIEWDYIEGQVVRDTCVYDTKGNILRISHWAGPYENKQVGYFFEYDYSKKAKYQFYLEETINLANGFVLLRYLDLFPELVPVNLRTRSRHGLETGSAVYDQHLGNHQVDAKGRLLGYDGLYHSPNGQTYKSFDVSLNWDCGSHH